METQLDQDDEREQQRVIRRAAERGDDASPGFLQERFTFDKAGSAACRQPIASVRAATRGRNAADLNLDGHVDGADLGRFMTRLYGVDVAVRYKQTVIGVAWALIRPLLTMVVFTVIFGRVAKLPSPGDVPYALLVFAAMLPWQFFATALDDNGNGNQY